MQWTPAMEHIAAFAGRLARKVLKRPVQIAFARDKRLEYYATYFFTTSPRIIVLNLGESSPWATWCKRPKHLAPSRRKRVMQDFIDMLIHEVSHEHGDHHEDTFEDALSGNGANVVELLMEDAKPFQEFLQWPTKRGK
jgi:hypothetical protein